MLIARFESSIFHQGFALRIGQGTLGTVRKVSRGCGDSMGQYQKPSREAGEEIVSEEYGRQIRPAGSLYSPKVISVMGWMTRRPFSRHQRKRSELRVGTMMPGPPKASAEAINAWRS